MPKNNRYYSTIDKFLSKLVVTKGCSRVADSFSGDFSRLAMHSSLPHYEMILISHRNIPGEARLFSLFFKRESHSSYLKLPGNSGNIGILPASDCCASLFLFFATGVLRPFSFRKVPGIVLKLVSRLIGDFWKLSPRSLSFKRAHCYPG